MNTILTILLFAYNFGLKDDVIRYDTFVREMLFSNPQFTSYLIDKDVDRIDEPRFKIKVLNNTFKGISFIDYMSEKETFTSILPIEDGYYFLISQKMLLRLTSIKSLDEIKVKCDYTCKCDCKCETKEVVTTKYETKIEYQKETNWWYVVGGTVLGFIVGGIVGLNY